MVDPDALYFAELRRAARGPQDDSIAGALEVELVASVQLKLVADWLRKDDPAELIQRQFGSHGYHFKLEFGNGKWRGSSGVELAFTS